MLPLPPTPRTALRTISQTLSLVSATAGIPRGAGAAPAASILSSRADSKGPTAGGDEAVSESATKGGDATVAVAAASTPVKPVGFTLLGR